MGRPRVASDSRLTETISLDESTQCLALFGGVYSNWLALEAAIADARACGARALFCLGDLGAFGPHPDRVFPILKQHDVVTIKGNYDDSLARGLDDCQCGYTDPRDNHFASISYRYTFTGTSASNKRWLGELPDQLVLEHAGRRIILCHGSPRRTNEFLWESTSSDSFLEKICRDAGADVLACTHTGIHWQRRLPSGRLVVNVGVLGRPANDGSTCVWYALLRRGREGGWSAEFRPVGYDHERLAEAMIAEELPIEFVDTIRTGWWTTCLEILPAKERRRGRW